MAINPELLPGPSGPGDVDPVFGPEDSGDLYPQDMEEHQKLLARMNAWFQAADNAREPHAQRWRKYHKMYRSFIEKKPGDWRSRVYIPIAFYVIETVTPRLVAQLPKFTALPVGEDDVDAAKHMETLLDNSVQQSDLYVELVKAFKSSLKYGTGLLKTYHRVDERRARKMEPLQMPIMQKISEPVIDPDTGAPMIGLDEQPIMDEREEMLGMMPMGERAQRYTYTAYDGPAAQFVDPFNFWVSPEATDLDDARYVFHRSFKDLKHIERKIAEGIYRLPEGMEPQDLVGEAKEPHIERLRDIGLGGGDNSDPYRKPVEILECYTDDGELITMANGRAIIRHQENPFDHGEKPFIRIVDYLAEGEFWGIGELEPLEGLQDLQNALVNSRIDNVRLVLNSMFAVNVQNVEDIRDLRMRPGGVIRLRGDFRPQEVIERVDIGDVTGSAFQEAEMNERTIEKVSGVSAYQMGLDSPSLNNTATGVAIIQEQGASRFGLKSKLAELLGLRRLGRHFGSIIQQFTTEEKVIRLVGPEGQMTFQRFAPGDLQGGLDYDIQSESTTQTQTMRLDSKMNLLTLVAQFAPWGVNAALEEVLDAMGVKDKSQYLAPPAPPMGLPAGASGVPPGMPSGPGQPPPTDPMAALGGATVGTQGQQLAQNMMAELAQSYNQGAQ